MKVLNFILRIVCDKNGEPSSMRISMMVLTIFVSMILKAIYEYIQVGIEMKQPIDWLGLAAFVTSIVALVGVILTGKIQQTRGENFYPTHTFEDQYSNFTENKNQ